ncbi:nucleoside deaminase [Synergistaceae bacterium OttesenSCG-928-I11]|nr:nucleoside deaminase [Synergistaceae bacterium OttesenSCG-928-I11]
MHDSEKLQKMLEIIRDEILPLTENEVSRGNNVFGGAILRTDTLTSVMVGSDNRVENPLFHGEIDTLNRFFKLPVRPDPGELIFLATHDPCPMCAAAIAVAGFKELWVLFGYKDIAETFGLQTDAEIYREVFGVEGARPENAFFTKHSLKKAVATSPDKEALGEILDEIEKRYESLDVKDTSEEHAD